MHALARILAVWMLTAGLFAQSGPDTSSEKRPPTARALLIGISDYASPAMQDLGGPRNDIELVEHLLRTRYGFEEQHITRLVDAEATRRRILAAFDKLANEASPEDVIFIHYSGHGSQVKDLNGDEEDGLDETLVPHDGRMPGVADLVDDELDARLAKLRTTKVTIVLDACHAGTGTRLGRGLACQKREVAPEPERRLRLYDHLRLRTRSGTPLEFRYVLMTGAAANQTALDGPIAGKAHGFFTYALVQALAASPDGAPVQEIFAQASEAHRRIQQQYDLVDLRAAQLEAARSRITEPLLPTLPGAARRPWLPVRGSGKPREFILTGGARLGAVPGSHWAIYARGETRFARGRALAWGTVYENAGDNAWLRLAWARKGRPQLEGGRAILISPEGAHALSVRIEGGTEAARRRMQQELRAVVPGVDFVGPERFARFIVDLQPVAHRLLGADGLEEIQSVPASAEGTRSVARLLSRSVMSSELLAISNPTSEMSVRVSLAGRGGKRHRPAPVRERGIKLVGASGTTGYHIRRPGEPRTYHNSLVLEIETDQDSFLTIVDVDSEGGVNVLFPNAISESSGFHAEGFVRAHQKVRIPDSLSEENRARFWFDYSDPAGLDTVRVFAAKDRATAELIRRSMRNIAAAPRQLGDVDTHMQDPRQQLVQELKRQLNTVVSRGVRIVSNRPETATETPAPDAFQEEDTSTGNRPVTSDWTAASLTILVEDRNR